LFPVIGFPQADEATPGAARCPDQNDHPSSQPSECDEPPLAIILAGVSDGQSRVFENLARLRHVQPPMFKGELTLGGVKFDLHFCYYIKSWIASFLLLQKQNPEATLPLCMPE
jgi:hypothetical protein